MKKLLLSIIVVLAIVLLGITVVNGFEIGKLTTLGVPEIKSKTESLDELIKQATKLTSTDYQQKQDELKVKLEELQNKRKEYEDLTYDDEGNTEIQLYEGYQLDFLWIRIGNHAKSEGIKMDVAAKDLVEVSTDSQPVQSEKKYRCNLSFTATGTYVGIASFIEDIEDDSELGFKIEEFKMLSSSEGTDILQATFVCKDILVKGISTSAVAPTEAPTANNQKSNENNTTNNTANNNTTNTVENNTTK